MSHRNQLGVVFLALMVLGLGMSGSTWADDAEAEAKARPATAEDADEADEETEDADDEEADEREPSEKVDPLAVPEGDAKDMVAFIQKLAMMRPKVKSPIEKARFQGLVNRAMADAADQGLAAEPSEQEALMLASLKFMALQRLKEAAEQELELAAAAAREDDRPGVASAGWRQLVSSVVMKWDEKSEREKDSFREALLDDFPEEPKQAAVRANAIRLATAYLEDSDADFAKELMKDAVVELEKIDDEKVRKVAEQLAGTLRRIDMMGKTMEITGPLLNGDEVDWESYRGKVVLVDFWATWCGPCVAELPNVKEMYAGYHEKGFDVLGISLDTSREKTETFIEKQEIPWQSMFGATEEDQGWDHPMARYYGISGIPTAILVDREGRVIHMNARGDTLREELQKLLGEPVEVEESDSEAGEEDTAEDGEETAEEAAGR